MRPDGRIDDILVHPFRDRGRFASKDADAPFILEDTFYGRAKV